jgi:tetratricopeptide (TPR) repeat protein
MKLVRAALAGNAVAALLCGMFMEPVDAPVARLLSNMANYVRKHPEEPDGYYTLGRIHYLAFATKRKSLPHWGWDGERPDGIANGYDQIQMQGRSVMPATARAEISDNDRKVHWADAQRLFRKAIELDPKNGRYELGLASLYEDGAREYAGPNWRELAIQHYLSAYQLTIQAVDSRTEWPVAIVCYEAGQAYARLVRQRSVQDSEAADVERIAANAAKFRPYHLLTPIVLSLRRDATLAKLVDPTAEVRFDLDGTGRLQHYSWLQPETALLVWDPERTGRITSGRQLFGNVTWWMFWQNGYQALAALDDNHDGWISGPELSGLSLWFDRNQNGVSDPGEVIPIEEAGVEALAVEADAKDGMVLTSTRGVRMKDGTVLPSWDWIATESPVGASEISPWREPWEHRTDALTAPEGRQRRSFFRP